MSYFSINLAGITLPDAIAATVEAWYDAQSVEEKEAEKYYTVEELQRILNKSRATIYRILNSDKAALNPPFDPAKLNHEQRVDAADPIRVSSNEIKRWKQYRPIAALASRPDPLPEPPKPKSKTWLFPDDGTVSCAEHIASVTSKLINAGHLKDGDKMPSTRDLAERVSCHRNTILKAYQEMERMGILEAKPGSGVYIADSSKLASMGTRGSAATPTINPATRNPCAA